MAGNNLTWIKGVVGAGAVNGVCVCVYDPLAELVFGQGRICSRLGVFGHIQQCRRF